MCFLRVFIIGLTWSVQGTTKYPVENEYSSFLAAHGGSSNAYTGTENTNYYFDVAADHLEGALDRFAQFFISPLFDDSCTERELQAVDSENKKNLQQDAWRLYQLDKDTSHPGHAYTKFGTGNIETLKTGPESRGLNIRDVLLDFHSKYYSANVMKLVIIGKESLDILESWAVSMFSPILNKDVPIPDFPGHPLTADELLVSSFLSRCLFFTHNSSQKITIAKPIKDMKDVELVFPFPDLGNQYKANVRYFLQLSQVAQFLMYASRRDICHI
jgi:insulysin